MLGRTHISLWKDPFKFCETWEHAPLFKVKIGSNELKHWEPQLSQITLELGTSLVHGLIKFSGIRQISLRWQVWFKWEAAD